MLTNTCGIGGEVADWPIEWRPTYRIPWYS
jgi:hypothetical protein